LFLLREDSVQPDKPEVTTEGDEESAEPPRLTLVHSEGVSGLQVFWPRVEEEGGGSSADSESEQL
jgi:hypothetical protein